MKFTPHFLTTHVGSVPHREWVDLCGRLAANLDIPAWPQLPRCTFRENMYVQYSPTLPGLVMDSAREKIYFDTTGDLTPMLEVFYDRYLSDDLGAFSLRPDYAAGFFAMLETLKQTANPQSAMRNSQWAKGQVTGPISFGLTVTDQDLRASLYNELLADVIVKNAAMNARWQIRQLKRLRSNVILFVDEPYMASFGSAFISLSREQVITMLEEVFTAIHAEGALAGVHCCGNTDWSVLLGTSVDILNLDAYGYLENLALYSAEVRAFLDGGGVLAWGIVPNNEHIWEVNPQSLAKQLRDGFQLISRKARGRGIEIAPEEFPTRSLIAPSCGLGPATVAIADRALEVLVETGEVLKEG